MFTKSSELGKPYKEDELKLGSIFLTAEKFIRERDSHGKVWWLKFEISPIQIMFIGYTNVYDGEVYQASYDQDAGYTDPPCFIQTKTHRVMVVQPIRGTRYTKPFYILSQKQKMGYWLTSESSTIEKQKDLDRRVNNLRAVLGIE